MNSMRWSILQVPSPFQTDSRFMFSNIVLVDLYHISVKQSLKKACKGKYYGVDPSNALCNKNLKTYNQLLDNIDLAHILEPNCPFAAKKPSKLLGGSSSRSLYETFHLKPNKDQRIRSPFRCRVSPHILISQLKWSSWFILKIALNSPLSYWLM